MFTRLFRFALIATAMFANPAHALDTEIYMGSNSEQEVKPNVVFILDTSGSMWDDNKTVYISDYDPNEKYTGACTDDKVYWGTNGTLPSCTGKQWFYANKNACESSRRAAATEVGFYTDYFAMWTGSSWTSPLSTANNNLMIECKGDAGWHGATAGTYYAAARGGPWTTSRRSAYSFSKSYQLYTANYLNYREAGGTAGGYYYRLEVVKMVLTNLLKSFSGINVAIMRFDGSGSSLGGYFITPMLELNDANRQSLIDAIKPLTGTSMTPLAETLYEAGLFYKGAPPKFGGTKNVAGVVSGGKYISPIKYQCQKNFIVLFSDGDPTSDDDADDLIKAQTDFSLLAPTCGFYSASGDCLASQAQYLYKKDLSEIALNDKQNVITYTIGLETDMSREGLALLQATASQGGGFYRGTKNAQNIIDAFNSIITNILSVNTSFTAPAVSVNAFNRLTHRDELYYALFRPSTQPRWDGNIKRYRLGKTSPTSGLAILDVNNADAIDPNTGFFKETARSFWSVKDANGNWVDDGEAVVLGGAAGNMPLPRTTYTCCFGTNDLTSLNNRLHEDNSTNLSMAELGAATEEERVNIIQWARGIDVNNSDSDGSSTDARTQMGDPLHTEPLLVTYGKKEDGITADLTLFATTNEGFLHAIDTSTGAETFSFMPQELLKNIKPLAQSDASIEHPFGLDGPISAWVDDRNADGTIDPVMDHVYLYLTMRRGGKNVYALDVTNRAKPKMLWVIKGGTGSFAELNDTWSRPVVANVKIGGAVKTVLFFGGGYDDLEDDYTNTHLTSNPDLKGRAIFMVDAATGELLWQAGPGAAANLRLTDMVNCFPSEIRVLDVNGNGLADRMYVPDMGGRVWRFDMNEAATGASDFATGGVLAKVSGTDKETNRRFYYPPSISMSMKGEYLNIAIGTGYREHPLDEIIQDRFYVIRDRNVDRAARDGGGNVVYQPLTNFVDATPWVTSADKALLSASDGYYIDLKTKAGVWEGEKVLAPALTINGVVIFTTFTPVVGGLENACAPSQGTAKEYYMNVEDSTTAMGTERYEVMVRSGIPPRPIAMTVEDGSAILIGTTLGPSVLAPFKQYKTNWLRK